MVFSWHVDSKHSQFGFLSIDTTCLGYHWLSFHSLLGASNLALLSLGPRVHDHLAQEIQSLRSSAFFLEYLNAVGTSYVISSVIYTSYVHVFRYKYFIFVYLLINTTEVEFLSQNI